MQPTLNSRKPYAGSHRALAIALDVGTTFSGVSYAFLEPGQVPKILGVTRYPGQEHVAGNSKIPSLLYYDRNGTVMAAGAEAEATQILAQAEDEEWTKVELFKLRLRPRTMKLDMNGMSLPPLPVGKTAEDVFGDFLRYMFRCTRKFIEDTHGNGKKLWKVVERDINFVLSHPNGWEGAQQSRMRRAAILGGLIPNTDEGKARVWFVTEGEASMHACILNGLAADVLADGNGFIVADAGGGTLDVSSYILRGTHPIQIEEVAPPDCVFSGAVFVSRRCRVFLEDKLKSSKYGSPDTLDHITKRFDETTKRLFRNKDEPQFIPFGSPLDKDLKAGIRAGQLKLTGAEVAYLFEPSIQDAVASIRRQVEASRGVVKAVWLVGGFAASPWLFSQLQERLTPLGITVNRPDTQTSKAVADGAIGFFCDHHVSARMSRYMYGVEYLREVDTRDPDHVSRQNRMMQLPSGPKLLPDAFDCILARNVRVKESSVFSRKYYTEVTKLSTLSVFEIEIWCYRGGNTVPKWIERHSDQFASLCHVKADLSKLTNSAEPKIGPNGQTYWTVVFNIEIHFGLTEFKARIKWVEDNKICYGPASIVYNEMGYRNEEDEVATDADTASNYRSAHGSPRQSHSRIASRTASPALTANRSLAPSRAPTPPVQSSPAQTPISTRSPSSIARSYSGQSAGSTASSAAASVNVSVHSDARSYVSSSSKGKERMGEMPGTPRMAGTAMSTASVGTVRPSAAPPMPSTPTPSVGRPSSIKSFFSRLSETSKAGARAPMSPALSASTSNSTIHSPIMNAESVPPTPTTALTSPAMSPSVSQSVGQVLSTPTVQPLKLKRPEVPHVDIPSRSPSLRSRRLASPGLHASSPLHTPPVTRSPRANPMEMAAPSPAPRTPTMPEPSLPAQQEQVVAPPSPKIEPAVVPLAPEGGHIEMPEPSFIADAPPLAAEVPRSPARVEMPLPVTDAPQMAEEPVPSPRSAAKVELQPEEKAVETVGPTLSMPEPQISNEALVDSWTAQFEATVAAETKAEQKPEEVPPPPKSRTASPAVSRAPSATGTVAPAPPVREPTPEPTPASAPAPPPASAPAPAGKAPTSAWGAKPASSTWGISRPSSTAWGAATSRPAGSSWGAPSLLGQASSLFSRALGGGSTTQSPPADTPAPPAAAPQASPAVSRAPSAAARVSPTVSRAPSVNAPALSRAPSVSAPVVSRAASVAAQEPPALLASSGEAPAISRSPSVSGLPVEAPAPVQATPADTPPAEIPVPAPGEHASLVDDEWGDFNDIINGAQKDAALIDAVFGHDTSKPISRAPSTSALLDTTEEPPKPISRATSIKGDDQPPATAEPVQADATNASQPAAQDEEPAKPVNAEGDAPTPVPEPTPENPPENPPATAEDEEDNAPLSPIKEDVAVNGSGGGGGGGKKKKNKGGASANNTPTPSPAVSRQTSKETGGGGGKKKKKK